MGIKSYDKRLSVSEITCDGTFDVELSLTAEPDIISNPTDIVLILDRSGSMAGKPLKNLKSGADKFIDIIAQTTGGTGTGEIGHGSRIGIVSFAQIATKDTQLITSVNALKNAVNNLNAGGATNHADAFTKALELFDFTSSSEKVMVMFTDGMTTAGLPPTPIAEYAKAKGVVIYVIGLIGDQGLDQRALEAWASYPPSEYVAITPDDEELEELFADIAESISKAGATGIRITDIINPCFKIVALSRPTKGTAVKLTDRSVEWEIDKLGETETETARFTFTVKHLGTCSGSIEVNEDLDYSDNEHHELVFPSPYINVVCSDVVYPEGCPIPVDVTIEGCDDAVEFDAGELGLESLGRLLTVDVTLKKICPGKRVALAVILDETDDEGNEYKRGLKTVTIPAHDRPECSDVKVKGITFVLPEDLDVSGDADRMCNDRTFRLRFIAHYIDNGYECGVSVI